MLNNERTMDGSLDAAQWWGEHYAQVLEVEGFSRALASSWHFFHNALQINVLVHGDDLFMVIRHEGRKHALNLLRGVYELSKVETLGPGVVTISGSQFLGKNSDIATVES